MKKTLLFALALIAVGCAEPEPRDLGELVRLDDVWLDRETLEPYSGLVFHLAPNDSSRIISRYTLKDGKIDTGVRETYAPESGQRFIDDFKNGELHGLQEIYGSNGQLESRQTYKNGELDGPFEYHHFESGGPLLAKGHYKNGELHGLFESYFLEGRAFPQRGTYNMGEKCGEWIEDGETVTYDPCPPDLADGN